MSKNPDLKIVKPTSRAQKATRTTVKTEILTRVEVEAWLLPSFQRQLKINKKVLEIAEQIKADGGIMPGIITLGILEGKMYLIDGQHRRAAFLESKCPETMVDLRVCHFDNMAEMAEEFVQLNTPIARLRADDTLRGLEGSYPALLKLRRLCPFITYDTISRGKSTATLSMSAALRTWQATSGPNVAQSSGMSAATLAKFLTEEDATAMAGFYRACHAAWGRDAQNGPLWAALNLALCAWLWRNMVIKPFSAKIEQMSVDLFTKCLMELSVDGLHAAWLRGRGLTELNRAPAYGRIKQLFIKRAQAETGKRRMLPDPQWGGDGRLRSAGTRK